MQDLPPGWRMSNVSGAYTGPPPAPEDDNIDGDRSSASGDDEDLDIRPDSPGWEDVEPDAEENLSVKCLLCQQSFDQIPLMLQHCHETHTFDFLTIRKRHNLDFYGTIKLVNYVRTYAAQGVDAALDVSDPRLWQDDKFLQPVLDDDVMLFGLDDLIEFGDGDEGESTAGASGAVVNGDAMDQT